MKYFASGSVVLQYSSLPDTLLYIVLYNYHAVLHVVWYFIVVMY